MMTFILLIIWILIIEAASSIENGDQTKILEETHSNDGRDGLHRNEVGKVINGESGQKRLVKGSYSYTDPDGKEVNVQYTSDENGYVTEKGIVLAASEAEPPTKAESPLQKIPPVTVASQLQIQQLMWFHQPGILPFVLTDQPIIPPFLLFHQPFKPSTMASYQPSIPSPVQTYQPETPTATPVIKPNKILYLPSHTGQMPPFEPDQKPHIIPPASYSYDDVIDVPTRHTEVEPQQVVPQPVLISLLGGGSG